MEAKAQQQEKAAGKKPKLITISIDDEGYEVEEKEHTVGELLELSGNDPATTYLVELKGKEEIEHQDPTEVIKLRNKARFITADHGPAPVA